MAKDENGKAKQKKIALRVDFTPMVDMNMLLITFFMLCTTLSKPQTMEISMPSRVTSEANQTKVRPDLAVTIILGENNKVYYYEGEPNYEDYTSLKESSYADDGLRRLLLRRNALVIKEVDRLKQERKDNKITQKEFGDQVEEAKKHKDALVVVIKPMDKSSYNNLIDALDEMLICNVGKYAIVEFSKTEDFLVKNLETRGNASKSEE